MSAAKHSTHIGFRTIRQADGAMGDMPFARCACGWEGPSRLKRGTAVRDGMEHLTDTTAAEDDAK